jgi:hypothetical protein
MFGYTEAQIASFGMTFGLGFGMVGFVAKYMIQWAMGIK